MFKRQDNGSYSEHARLRGEFILFFFHFNENEDKLYNLGNCAFILPDLNPERHHDFRVFTKNKYGDNSDKSYSITVGKPRGRSLFRLYLMNKFL